MAEQEARPPEPPLDRRESTAETEARDAIAAFEEILDVFPNDVGTLDALAQSYHLVGEADKERIYLKRLIQVLLDQGDTEAAGEHAGRLNPRGDDPEATALLEQLEAMGVSGMAAEAQPEETPPADEPALEDRGAVTDAEVELAWALHEAQILSEDEYADLVRDLTDLSAQDAALTLSVLHVLNDRTSRALDPALAYIMQESRAPPAPLDCVEPDEENLRLLPMDVMITQGLAVFDHVGKELLVASINPLRKGLRESLTRRLGQPCHLFCAHPGTFDAWIERVQKLLKDRGAP